MIIVSNGPFRLINFRLLKLYHSSDSLVNIINIKCIMDSNCDAKEIIVISATKNTIEIILFLTANMEQHMTNAATLVIQSQ